MQTRPLIRLDMTYGGIEARLKTMSHSEGKSLAVKPSNNMKK